MALCKKKVKDINPCSPTFGAIVPILITCPPVTRPALPCNIVISSVLFTPTDNHKSCSVIIRSISITI